MERLKHIVEINIVLGAWLILAPFVMGYSGSTVELTNDVALGVLLIGCYLNDIFAAAGASKYSAGMQSVIIGCTNLFFTLVAMTLINKLGRKKLLLAGTAGVCIFLVVIGQIFFAV